MALHIKRATVFGALAAVALVGFGVAPVSAKDLIYGSWPPQREYLNAVTLPKVFKEMAKETNGEVQWKLVAGGQLASPKGTFAAVQNGVIQAGLGISTYAPNVVPALNTIYSSVVFDADAVAATGAAVETLTLDCPGCIAEFKRINAVPLSGWTSSPYYLTCRTPVRSLADLKGKRVRATGGNVELMQMFGAVPVAATLTDAVGLLQHGGIDCFFGIVGWLRSFGYADFAKYITDIPLGLTGPAIGMTLNRDAWNGLTDKEKTLFLKEAADISARQAVGQFIVENKEILDDLVEKHGVKLIEPTDRAKWLAIVEKFQTKQRSENIANAKRFGVTNPAAIITAYRKNIVKWKKLTAGVGTDIDKFAALMWKEIYSKVDIHKI